MPDASPVVDGNQPSPHGPGNKAGRVAWAFARCLLFRPTPDWMRGWRRFVLRALGATIHPTAKVSATAEIWAPWRLSMARDATMGAGVRCYNVARIEIGEGATVSQHATLCAASHDYSNPRFPVVSAPIVIEAGAWVASEAFVSMGVRIGRNAVIGARSVVTKDMPADTVCAGNPCRPIRPRWGG